MSLPPCPSLLALGGQAVVGDGDGPLHLPAVLRVDLDGHHGAVPLPEWPDEIASLAFEECSGVTEDELLSFALGVRFLAFARSADLLPLGIALGVPAKRRSVARSQAWLVQHWPRPQVQTRLLLQAIRTATPGSGSLSGGDDSESPRTLLRRLVEAGDSRTKASAAGALLRTRRSDGHTDVSLPALVWCFLRGAGDDLWEEAAERIAKNPRVHASRVAVLDALGESGRAEFRTVLAALYLLSADRKVQATSFSPEVRLANLEHETRALHEQVDRLTRERDGLLSQVEALETENREWFELYTNLSRTRSEAVGEPIDLPLRGLTVVIAGDPQHARGYRDLCVWLGAADVEVLDAVSDSAPRIATRMETADLPVLVTAWATHKTQMAIETRLSRRELILVHRAGLYAMRTVLVEAAGRLAGRGAGSAG